MLNVLLTRHAQSEWNEVGRWQGQADPPLSDLGRAQAQGAISQCGGFDAVVSSDLDRAVTTAQIIAEALGVGPVLLDPDFRERHAGAYQGLTRAEIDEQFPGNLDADIWPPGWESAESVLARAMAGLGRIVERSAHGEVLVVSHGGIIYSLEGHLGEPHQRIANLAGRWLHHNGTDWRVGQRVQLSPEKVTIESQDLA